MVVMSLILATGYYRFLNNMADYGKRADGTDKGAGFYGEVKRPDGDISTEISIGVDYGSGEKQIPTMVPGLTKDELDSLLKGDEPSGAIVDKAVAHAREREKAGKSPFAGAEDKPIGLPQAPKPSIPAGSEDKGPPPWERVWNSVKESVNTFTQPIDNIIEQAKAPWEMSWSAARKVDPNASVQPNKADNVQNASERFQNVLGKLINTESGGRHRDANGELLTSNKGAKGITQVLDSTAQAPGFGVTPIQNTSEDEYKRFGNDYLKALLKNFNGNYEYAVAAYNAGPGNVQKAINQAEKKGGDFKLYLPEETRKYVKNILGSSVASRAKGAAEATLGFLTGSGNANAAADFSDFTKGNKTETGKMYGGGTYESQSQGVRTALVSTIQDKFPQFVSDINTKVLGEKAEGAIASYGGLGGDTIKAGSLKGATVKQTTPDGKVTQMYDSPKELSEPLSIMLHEIQHARMDKIGKFDYGLGGDWKDMLKDAEKASFPSVGTGVGGGDNLNEFLATATVIKEMKKAGYPIEGKFAGPAKELTKMEAKYPWLRQYIVNYVQPEPLGYQKKK